MGCCQSWPRPATARLPFLLPTQGRMTSSRALDLCPRPPWPPVAAMGEVLTAPSPWLHPCAPTTAASCDQPMNTRRLRSNGTAHQRWCAAAARGVREYQASHRSGGGGGHYSDGPQHHQGTPCSLRCPSTFTAPLHCFGAL